MLQVMLRIHCISSLGRACKPVADQATATGSPVEAGVTLGCATGVWECSLIEFHVLLGFNFVALGNTNDEHNKDCSNHEHLHLFLFPTRVSRCFESDDHRRVFPM